MNFQSIKARLRAFAGTTGIALSLLALPGAASAGTPYVGIDFPSIGWVTVDDDIVFYNDNEPYAELAAGDEQGMLGISLRGGYQFDNDWLVEVGYRHYRTTFLQSLFDGEYRMWSVQAMTGYSWHAGKWSFTPKLGVQAWDLKIEEGLDYYDDSTDEFANFDYSLDGVAPIGSVGGEYRMTHVGLGLNYTYSPIDDGDFQSVELSLRIPFD